MSARFLVRAFAALALLVLLCPPPLGAFSGVVYEVPVGWIRIEEGADQEVYQTSFDPASRLFVRIRVTDTGAQDAESWALEESSTLSAERGFRVGSPKNEQFGQARWAYVDWHDPAEDERGRQYYLEAGPSALVSVGISARSSIFLAADAAQFDDFLSSFRAKAEGA